MLNYNKKRHVLTYISDGEQHLSYKNMSKKLINYFSKITNLAAEEIELLTDTMVIKSYPKGNFLVEEGQFNSDTYFVLDGLVRQYKVIEGNDITINFFSEEQWIISLEEFNTRLPSKFNLICTEDTRVVIGNEQKAQELFKQFPRFEKISRQIMETVFLAQQNSMTSYVTNKPEQRYLALLNSRPDIFQRVPQYDIASFIGVKPESLSRIRKKLLKK